MVLVTGDFEQAKKMFDLYVRQVDASEPSKLSTGAEIMLSVGD